MSTFARSTFSAAGYAAFRPSYPSSLLNTVLQYHRSQKQKQTQSTPPGPSNNGNLGTLLDLGCGHGVISRSLSRFFDRVIAVDPSEGMVKQAAALTSDTKITFEQASAEDLHFIADGSVDLVVAGQAAHWFQYDRLWPELSRVVRRGGSLAFWGYKDNILVGYPAANDIFDRACYGEGQLVSGVETMAAYWEQPGREILRDSLREVKPPTSDWTDEKRLVYEPDREGSSAGIEGEDGEDGKEEAAWLRKTLKLGEFEGYVRTFSAYSGWRDAHPEVRSRAEGGEGDVVDVMFDQILEAVPQWKAGGRDWREVEVESVWGTALIMARRK